MSGPPAVTANRNDRRVADIQVSNKQRRLSGIVLKLRQFDSAKVSETIMGARRQGGNRLASRAGSDLLAQGPGF